MLLPQKLKIKWIGKNANYYKEKGYEYTKHLDEFEVDVFDLPKSSHKMVKYQCDYCGKTFEKTFSEYNRQRESSAIQKDSCSGCKGLKTKESNMIKYGVESTNQLKEVQAKKVDTFNVKYGVGSYFQTEKFKTDIIQYNLEKYGYESHNQSEEIKEKKKESYIDKYGVENPSQLEEVKEKVKQTLMKNYGVEHPSKSKVIRERVIKTNLERYGVECTLQNEEVRKKSRESYYKNNTIKTSSQQLEIYEMLKENGYKVELNFPVSNVNLDVAIFIGDIKIDLEYDSWYWHKDKQLYDRRRDEFLKSKDWKVIRIKSKSKVPEFNDIEKAINSVLKPNRKYKEIILSDWKLANAN